MNTPTLFHRALQQYLKYWGNGHRVFYSHAVGRELKKLTRMNHAENPSSVELENLVRVSIESDGFVMDSLAHLVGLANHRISANHYDNEAILRQIADHEEQIRILRAKLK